LLLPVIDNDLQEFDLLRVQHNNLSKAFTISESKRGNYTLIINKYKSDFALIAIDLQECKSGKNKMIQINIRDKLRYRKANFERWAWRSAAIITTVLVLSR
jgi:hypothetical protein